MFYVHKRTFCKIKYKIVHKCTTFCNFQERVHVYLNSLKNWNNAFACKALLRCNTGVSEGTAALYFTGSGVKQADVVLLGYPLAMCMTPEVRRSDLEAYEAVTDPLGPAMTWVSHTIPHPSCSLWGFHSMFSCNKSLCVSVWRACLLWVGLNLEMLKEHKSFCRNASKISRNHFRYVFEVCSMFALNKNWCINRLAQKLMVNLTKYLSNTF